jgi:hypothetical protein
MPREGHLRARRENPNLGGVSGLLRWKNERRFRKIELGGDGLHLIRQQPMTVTHDCQRISPELPIGENINRREVELHPRCLSMDQRFGPIFRITRASGAKGPRCDQPRVFDPICADNDPRVRSGSLCG